MPAEATASGHVLAADAVSDLLLPFWQLVIGSLVVFFVIAAGRQLARRGPSRMTTALLVTAGAIIGLATIGYLMAAR